MSYYDKYKKKQKTYTYTHDGKDYYLDFGEDGYYEDQVSLFKGPIKGTGYIGDDASARSRSNHSAMAIAFFFKHGREPSREEFNAILSDAGIKVKNRDVFYRNAVKDLNRFLENNNLDKSTFGLDIQQANEQRQENAKDSALSDYYKDVYSLNEGTTGRNMYDELAGIYERQADAELLSSQVMMQNQAMQQAQVIKQITDQVKAERMARLRAGMSQAQIANQDMMMMMSNVQAINENAQMMSQQRLAAQTGKSLARDQAYMEYMKQANERGQAAAAFDAAGGGNAYMQAGLYAAQTGVPFDEAYGIITNQNKDKQ